MGHFFELFARKLLFTKSSLFGLSQKPLDKHPSLCYNSKANRRVLMAQNDLFSPLFIPDLSTVFGPYFTSFLVLISALFSDEISVCFRPVFKLFLVKFPGVAQLESEAKITECYFRRSDVSRCEQSE